VYGPETPSRKRWGFLLTDQTDKRCLVYMEQFYTRDKANEGVTLPLSLPNGDMTEESLTILGIDSDDFKRANTEEQRKISTTLEIAAKIDDDEERLAFVTKREADSKLIILAALIKAWSFEEECTEENKINFLRNAPQIADAINSYAADRKRFFGNG